MNNYENFVWIKGYEGLYKINESGVIVSFKNKKKPREMKIIVGDRGYCYILLTDIEGNQKRHYIHRLVLINFVREPQPHEQANHIDGCKSNNHVSNLEWCTASENRIHAVENKLTKTKKKIRRVRCIETGVIYDNATQAGRDLGCDASTIRRICRKAGLNKSIHGLHFEYVD